jgi:hypothetical protein
MASASQSTNPYGAVVAFDGEVPRTYTAVATETVSGGFLVQMSGATGDVGSHINSYQDGDLKAIGAQIMQLCNGLALNNAGSEDLVTVATRGAYLMRAGEIVSGGALVMHNASGNVANWIIADSGTGTIPTPPIGRARTTSASGTNNFALVDLNL